MGWNRVVLATLAIVFVFTEASGDSEADVVTELDPGPCVLDAGPSLQPKELLNCTNLPRLLKIKSLPAFVRGISVKNAPNGVIFERGSIRIREKKVFKVTVVKASQVDFREKSTTILVSNGTVHFNLREIAHLKMRSRAVSSSSGNFELFVEKSVMVDIDGQAFDIMNKVQMNDIAKLNLAPGAFKPNAPLFMQQPFTKIHLDNIHDLPTLPMEAFSSAHSISISRSSIGGIESSSFSGAEVFNISFESSKIERIHSSAFPEKSLVHQLTFVNCTLTSVSENAVTSAISQLQILNTTLSSISSEAFKTYVAKVEVKHSVFQTLVRNSFVFKSWNQVVIEDNFFKFLGELSFMGISEPNSPSAHFKFVGNQIKSVNKDGLKIDTTNEAIFNHTSDNIFQQVCECKIGTWLMIVSGERNHKNPSAWTQALVNSSLCRVPDFAQGCFNKDQTDVLFTAYTTKMCTTQLGQDCSNENPLNLIIEQIKDKVQSTQYQGLLLVVLIFVLAASLIIGIITLFRWIVYSIQTRKFKRKEDWSFTKIEEQQQLKENDVIQEAIELEESPSPTQHYESLALTANTEVNTPPPDSNTTKKDSVDPLLEAKLPEHATAGKPPTQTTFYDEMICLLQGKLVHTVCTGCWRGS